MTAIGLILLGLGVPVFALGVIGGYSLARWVHAPAVVDPTHRIAMHALAYGDGPRRCRHRQRRSAGTAAGTLERRI